MALKSKVASMKEAEAEEEFEFPSLDEAAMDDTAKVIIAIYGDKGDSKSTLSYSIMEKGDSCFVLSFDGKSAKPLKIPFIKDMNLEATVVDPTVFYTKSTDSAWLASAVKTNNYVNHLLTQVEERGVDWIVFDCTEVMKEIAEMCMRAKFKLGVFAGSPFQNWRERGRILDNMHEQAFKAAKKGVIYTFYPKTKEMLVKDGQVIDSKTTPAWIGSIMRESDIKIRVSTKKGHEGWKYMATIESSKEPFYKEGSYDVTDKCLRNILNMVASE